MKTSTKRTTKVVVALVAAIITTIIILLAYQPSRTAGDSENVGATLVTTVVTTTEESSFFETTTASTSTTSTTIPTTTEITTTTTHTTTSSIVTEVETTQAVQTTYETTKTIEIIPETTTTVVTETYVVYKPATHYIHMNTCRWAASGEVQRIESTEGIEARRCSECNLSMEIITEYVEPVPEVTEPTGSMSYVKHFTRGTYYAYGGPRKGGSQRQLIDCSTGDGTVKGSIASSYLYRNYGYNYNGKRTMVYLEIEGYSQMNGYYYLDDCDAGNPNVIDFFFLYGSNCPFQRQGVVQVDCYIVNY